MSWNPSQYLRFAAPRLRPALDLLARVPDAPLAAPLAVDLGCGTGSATRLIAARWPDAEVVGVDASAAMLGPATAGAAGAADADRAAAATATTVAAGASAAPAAADASRVRFEQADIAHWRAPAPAGLIFSNAALHWLDDHASLWPALLAQLAPGGVLAVQMPRNFDAPSHTLIAETVHAGPWRARLAPLLRPVPVAPPRWHVERLAPLSATLDIWETEYLHLLEGPDPVKEWTKGTWLAPLLQALPDDEAAAFEAEYARRLRAAYPPLPDGRTPFPFRRLFIVATR